ncbi:MAG: 2-C-methyl-D-erythritol 4-phosphate cytidylyltransferase [Clostridia bacterium]|nr:2-C-methyl-D-erythritol 4-phosphate cytidylyltransferase [Clostridia bacterium]
MPKLDFSLSFQKNEEAVGGFPVIVVAAGSASRMKGVDKMFAPLLGVPTVIRTLKAFEDNRNIASIAVVTREEKIAEIRALAEKYAISKLDYVVAGGSCREDSVKNGLILYKDKYSKALVHDGARPLVSGEVIDRVAEALNRCDNVTCAVPLKDTVKEIDEDGLVISTPDRAKLVSVQTPQGISIDAFFRSSEENDLSSFTDDTSVLSAVGVPTQTVAGDYMNIKITTPEDLAVAEMYLGKEL